LRRIAPSISSLLSLMSSTPRGFFARSSRVSGRIALRSKRPEHRVRALPLAH
jgi:hypothetical protein